MEPILSLQKEAKSHKPHLGTLLPPSQSPQSWTFSLNFSISVLLETQRLESDIQGLALRMWFCFFPWICYGIIPRLVLGAILVSLDGNAYHSPLFKTMNTKWPNNEHKHQKHPVLHEFQKSTTMPLKSGTASNCSGKIPLWVLYQLVAIVSLKNKIRCVGKYRLQHSEY